MGQFRPKDTTPYVSEVINQARDALADAIRHELIVCDLSPSDVRRHAPTFRRGTYLKFMRHEGGDMGIKQLAQIAEAVGLRLRVEIDGRTA